MYTFHSRHYDFQVLDAFYSFLRDQFNYGAIEAREIVKFIADLSSYTNMESILQNDKDMEALLFILEASTHFGIDKANALRLYYYFRNNHWFNNYLTDRLSTKQEKNIHLPDTTYLPSFIETNHTYCGEDCNSCRFPYKRVRYGNDVKDSDKINGLKAHICEVATLIMELQFHLIENTLTKNHTYVLIHRIPYESRPVIILSGKQPVKQYPKSLKDFIKDFPDVKDFDFTDLTQNNIAHIKKILKNKYYYDRITGMYFPSDKRIEIYYKNFSIGNSDINPNKLYFEAIRNCLAHEMFHYFHHVIIDKEFLSKEKYRTEVIEALADFYSVMFSLYYGDNHHAKKRYKAWKDRFGTYWPYANALYFFMREGGLLPLTEITKFPHELCNKPMDVTEATYSSMNLAYQVLINQITY